MLCYCYCNLLNAQNHHHWPPCKGTAIQVDIFVGHPKYPSRKLCIHFIQYVTSPLKALNISSIPPFWLNELKINTPFKMFYNTKLMLSSISTCFWAVNYDSFILKLMFFYIPWAMLILWEFYNMVCEIFQLKIRDPIISEVL